MRRTRTGASPRSPGFGKRRSSSNWPFAGGHAETRLAAAECVRSPEGLHALVEAAKNKGTAASPAWPGSASMR